MAMPTVFCYNKSVLHKTHMQENIPLSAMPASAQTQSVTRFSLPTSQDWKNMLQSNWFWIISPFLSLQILTIGMIPIAILTTIILLYVIKARSLVWTIMGAIWMAGNVILQAIIFFLLLFLVISGGKLSLPMLAGLFLIFLPPFFAKQLNKGEEKIQFLPTFSAFALMIGGWLLLLIFMTGAVGSFGGF